MSILYQALISEVVEMWRSVDESSRTRDIRQFLLDEHNSLRYDLLLAAVLLTGFIGDELNPLFAVPVNQKHPWPIHNPATQYIARVLTSYLGGPLDRFGEEVEDANFHLEYRFDKKGLNERPSRFLFNIGTPSFSILIYPWELEKIRELFWRYAFTPKQILAAQQMYTSSSYAKKWALETEEGMFENPGFLGPVVNSFDLWPKTRKDGSAIEHYYIFDDVVVYDQGPVTFGPDVRISPDVIPDTHTEPSLSFTSWAESHHVFYPMRWLADLCFAEYVLRGNDYILEEYRANLLDYIDHHFHWFLADEDEEEFL